MRKTGTGLETEASVKKSTQFARATARYPGEFDASAKRQAAFVARLASERLRHGHLQGFLWWLSGTSTMRRLIWFACSHASNTLLNVCGLVPLDLQHCFFNTIVTPCRSMGAVSFKQENILNPLSHRHVKDLP